MTAEVVVKATVPAGSRFKGCQDILVRELRLSAKLVRYRRERWLTGVPIVAAGLPTVVAVLVGSAKSPSPTPAPARILAGFRDCSKPWLRRGKRDLSRERWAGGMTAIGVHRVPRMLLLIEDC